MPETSAPNLTPLPLGLNEGLKPFGSAEATAKPAVTEPIDPVEQWMTETPKEFQATEPIAAELAVPPITEPAATEPDKPATPATAPLQATTEKPADKVADTPIVTPEAATKPAKPAEPAQPPKPTLAADEKIALADGVEWTRSQIVEGLKERSKLTPLAKEGENFTKLFGMPYEEALKNWGPVLQRLGTEPNTVAFIDGYLGNPAKAAYLEKCARDFDAQQPPATAAPNPPAADTQLAKEVADLRAWRAQEEKKAATDRLNREVAEATQKYPFLATDQGLMQDLVLTAKALNAQDQSKGLLDALALKATMYDAILIARKAQTTTDTAVTPPQPALVTPSGASPTGTRPVANGKPKSFSSTDDAVEDWYQNPPQQFE